MKSDRASSTTNVALTPLLWNIAKKNYSDYLIGYVSINKIPKNLAPCKASMSKSGQGMIMVTSVTFSGLFCKNTSFAMNTINTGKYPLGSGNY